MDSRQSVASNRSVTLAVLHPTIYTQDELLDQFEELSTGGTIGSEPETVGLRDVSEMAWTVVETEDAELTVTGDETFLAHRGQLQQLLENLFKNAVEHAGPDVTVSVGVLDDGGFFVEDDGPGIPRAERSRVFEMGESLDPDGAGVGLAICKRIADVHGWDIDVTDGAEGGARFEIDVGET